jgi:pimeloyl-ACP methyl ester carboxylesterase
VLDRFDVVGFDPRGTNFSDNVRCFKNIGVQDDVLAGLSISFPYTKAEEKAAVSSAGGFGKACGSTGQPLAGSMSTAEVARDMDLLRRAVGDKKLTYLGFSYGTYLGQVYANMFPDRVRALVIDGVLDPVGWAGTAATAAQPQTDRIRSADGAYRALKELFVLCKKAGEEACPLLTRGDPAEQYDKAAKRLQAHPLVIEDEYGTFTYSYADFVGESLGALYSAYSAEFITQQVSQVLDLTDPTPPAAAAKAARTKALRAFAAKQRTAREARKANGPRGFDFAYYNDYEAFSAVLCSDGLNPASAAAWPAAAVRSDARAKYFGRAWLWSSVQCASHTWTAQDEDVYRGPFNRRTAAPVLVIGSYWDPATFYDNAKLVAKLLPNARLLSSDNWGHTAFGTSDCVTNATSDYLVRLTLPKAGTVCHGDVQPYQQPPASLRSAPAGKGAPVPVVPLVPGGPTTH